MLRRNFMKSAIGALAIPFISKESQTEVHRIRRYPDAFQARTDTLLDYPWDERMMIAGEHLDFFMRLRSNHVRIADQPSEGTNTQIVAIRMDNKVIAFHILDEDNPEFGVKRVNLHDHLRRSDIRLVPYTFAETRRDWFGWLQVRHSQTKQKTCLAFVNSEGKTVIPKDARLLTY